MGRVFAARDLELDREVAVKVLASGVRDAEDERRLEQEARTAGALADPNILIVHDIGHDESGPYVVSELLEGETLRLRLAGRALPLRKALEYGVQLARGLSAAHEKGLVHRDIKPENLFITHEGRLKILDFGIARPAAAPRADEAGAGEPALTTASGAVGTVAYMSPEQVRGSRADHRSDLFSAGVVLYEMLAGRRPFEGTTPLEVGWAIVSAEPPALPEQVPGDLDRLVRRCLEKDPAERFQSARDLAFALETLQLPPARTPAGKAPRRLWVALIALATVAAGAVAVAGALAIRRALQRAGPGNIRQITFKPGVVGSARFAPDGRTVVYSHSAALKAPPELFSLRLGTPESRALGLPAATLLAVSSAEEMAILLRPKFTWFDYQLGTLGRVALGGDAIREVVEEVQYADWGPGDELAVVRSVGSRTRLEFPYKHAIYETTGWISHPRFSPRKDRIAFLDHPSPADDAGSVSVVDLAGQVQVLASGWKSAQGLAWSPSGSEIWFTAAAADEPFSQNVLRAVDLSGRQRLLSRAAGRLKLEDVSGEGNVLVTQPDPHVGLAVKLEGRPEKDLSWLELPMLSDLSADGSTVLFTENGSGAGPSYAMFIRKTDGSSPVALGPGQAAALSPDGKWVLSMPVPPGTRSGLTLVPVGPGEARTVETGAAIVAKARWLPDGKSIVMIAAEPGHAARLYLQPLAPEPAILLYPVGGGQPAKAPATTSEDTPIGFGSDGLLFVRQRLDFPARVWRIDFARRTRTQWIALTPGQAGADGVGRILMTHDGRSFAYNYSSRNSHLYLLEHLE